MKSLAAVLTALTFSLALAPKADALCGPSCLAHKAEALAHGAASVAKSAAKDATKAKADAAKAVDDVAAKAAAAVTPEDKKRFADALADARKVHEDAKAAEAKALAAATKKADEEAQAHAKAIAEAKKEADAIKKVAVDAGNKAAGPVKEAADKVAKITAKPIADVRKVLDKGCSDADRLQKKTDELGAAAASGSVGEMNKALTKFGKTPPGGAADVGATSGYIRQLVAIDAAPLNAAAIACNVSLTSLQKDIEVQQKQFDLWCGPNTPIGEEKAAYQDLSGLLANPTLAGEEAVAKKYSIPLPHSHEDASLELEANKLAIETFISAAFPAPVKLANKACTGAQAAIDAQKQLPSAYAFVKKHI